MIQNLNENRLAQYWYPLNPHPEQNQALTTDKKYVNLVAGRGSGKTEISRRRIVQHLAIEKPWPDPIYVYCLPTFQQAKKVAWKPLLNLIPDYWIKKDGINISDYCISTIFGATLYVAGMDKPQRIEGLQIDGIVIDESSDQKPGIMRTVSPMLTHRNAWCWRIGVPKRTGIGKIEFREAFEKGLLGDPNILSLTWKSSSVLTQEQLEEHRSNMTEQDFREQFEAEWLDLGGSIYHAFSSENEDENIKYNPEMPIIVGADFNVDPMCWVLGHKYGEGDSTRVEIFDEVFLRNTNTVNTLKHLAGKFPAHEAGWRFFCDASTRQRKTNASRTDYLIIRDFEDLKNKTVHYPDKNPAIQDRFNMVNAALCNAKEERRLFVHPRCKHLIVDFKMMAYKEGTTDPENYTGTDVGHMSDGLGYAIVKLIPLRYKPNTAPGIFTSQK